MAKRRKPRRPLQPTVTPSSTIPSIVNGDLHPPCEHVAEKASEVDMTEQLVDVPPSISFAGTAGLQHSMAHKLQIEAARHRGQDDANSHVQIDDLFRLLDRALEFSAARGAREYSKAIALFIRWEQDDCGSGQSDRRTDVIFAELQRLLSESFGFEFKELVLDAAQPALKLQSGLASFIGNHDDADTLLSIIYSGPSSYETDLNGQHMVIWQSRQCDGPKVVWTDFEAMLSRGRSRVLMLANSFYGPARLSHRGAAIEGIWAASLRSPFSMIYNNHMLDWILFQLHRTVHQKRPTTVQRLLTDITDVMAQSTTSIGCPSPAHYATTTPDLPSIELWPCASIPRPETLPDDMVHCTAPLDWPLVQLSVQVEVPPGIDTAGVFIRLWKSWQDLQPAIIHANDADGLFDRLVLRKCVQVDSLALGLGDHQITALLTLPEKAAKRVSANAFSTFLGFVSSANVLPLYKNATARRQLCCSLDSHHNQICHMEPFDKWAIEDGFTTPSDVSIAVQKALATMEQHTQDAIEHAAELQWSEALQCAVNAAQAQGVANDCLEMAKWPGKGNPYSLLGLKNLAVALLCSKTDFALAEQFFVSLLDAFQRLAGQQHEQGSQRVLSVRYCLAYTYSQSGQWDKACEAWESLIATSKTRSGMPNALLIACLMGNAQLHRDCGLLLQAALLEMQAMKVLKNENQG